MAGLGQKFDPTAHDTEQRDYENLPDGDYKLEISSSDVVTSEGKTVLKVTNDVVEPEQYKGRKVFNNYNLENPSAQAQEIGQKQFAALCRAIGISDPVEDSEDLHFRPYMVKIGMGKDSKEKNADGSPKYAARNEIKRYYFPDEGEVPAPKAAPKPAAANDNRRPANDNQPAQQQAATGITKSRPWGKK